MHSRQPGAQPFALSIVRQVELIVARDRVKYAQRRTERVDQEIEAIAGCKRAEKRAVFRASGTRRGHTRASAGNRVRDVADRDAARRLPELVAAMGVAMEDEVDAVVVNHPAERAVAE